jgi:transcription-repair coupling factor (superfamily II helicase)
VISVAERIAGDGTFRALLARIRELDSAARPPSVTGFEGVVCADGLWGSFAPILAGTTAGKLKRPLLYVTAHLEQADEVRDDLELFCGRTPELLSAFETLPGEGAAADEIHAERVRLCTRLQDVREGADSERDLIIVAPIQALMQPVPSPEALTANLLTLAVGQQQAPHELAEWLVERGYTRLDQVESPGDFALRGEILDIWPPAEVEPYRVDFFGDTIESIRRFEVSSQRSEEELPLIRVAGRAMPSHRAGGRRGAFEQKAPTPTLPRSTGGGRRPSASPSNTGGGSETSSFFAYLPADTLVAFAEPIEIQELGKTFWTRLGSPRGMLPVDKLFRRANEFTQLHLYALSAPDFVPQATMAGPKAASESASTAGEPAGVPRFTFGVQSLTRFETKTAQALEELHQLAGQRDVLLYCDNEPERQRFEELWGSTIGAVPPRLHMAIGLMHRGFDWPDGRLALVGHHEVFHRYLQRRRIRRAHAARPIESWLDLQTGDYVVHIVHGIARFMGLRTMAKSASAKSEEYLTLEFAEGARMHVPVTQIDLVQKYIGAGATPPPLTKLGGTRWTKTKERVEESIEDLAGDLLRIQATRASQPGIAYPEDTPWQNEFEGSFIYTETEDQLTALAELKKDLRRPSPMDRLLCGDVGYGKTELAMRAAFKVAEYGKQVAVLVPTTVLAEQHERTFRERFADYPFTIESVSRFKTKKQQDEIIARARKGQVDVLIGTHRILSKDVGFKDLGLVIVDEEQRFGVEHKERLKRFRETVEVLTMSATPIPRTLHMSMLGIRDISSLATPPMDRRSIVTRVSHWDETLIRDSIIREMNRDGQVFFVHNFVHDIESFADTIQRIVPEARLLIGHGQMREHELENVMIRFIRHEADVLVCTTIIESGLDIPNCNTILIDRAERFGLSELHQLRGRVGRYKHRAYCYLLLPPGKPLTDPAARRLKAIEEYSDLGAGFRIAMRDLEIRGAGNILGPEQSGHIAAVGYELYCQLLDSAVRRLKNEPADTFRPVHLELDVPSHIPRSYIESDRQRMEIYRRLARCRSRAELEQLDKDLRDAFGPYPPVVQTLLDLAEIRILCQPLKIRAINQQRPDLIFTVDDLRLLEPMFAASPGSARMADANTVHLRLSESYFEPTTLLPVLRRMLQAGAEAMLEKAVV